MKRAFTLIELLVVVVIIGLLVTVATTSFLNAQRNSRDNARKSGVEAIANALEAYKLVNGSYPGLSDDTSGSACLGAAASDGQGNTFTAYYDSPSASTGCLPSSSYAPTPNWIPGLGKYLNPAPTDPSYQGFDGGSASVGTFDYQGKPLNQTRTLSYQKTATGYFVNARMESDSSIFTVSK